MTDLNDALDSAIIEAIDMSHVDTVMRNPDAPRTAFLASLAASGYAIVPREATEDMHNAARDWSLNRYHMAIGRDASEVVGQFEIS